MENNNIRTMEYIGEDSWNRPVYKCIETGNLWKGITLGSKNPSLYSCGNNFDGEPDCPIKSSLEIKFINKAEEEPNKFNYMMLDRLRSDCDYYLGYGNRNKGRLCEKDEQKHIDEMKKLYNSFHDDKKPEWLTYEQILTYEKLMTNK